MNEDIFGSISTDQFEETPESKTLARPYIPKNTFVKDDLVKQMKEKYNADQRAEIIKNASVDLRELISSVIDNLISYLEEEKDTPTYASLRWHSLRQDVVDKISITRKLIWEIKKEKRKVAKEFAAGKMNEVFRREFQMLDVKKSWQDKNLFKDIVFQSQEEQLELLNDLKDYLEDTKKTIDNVLFNMRSFYDDYANRQRGMW